MFNFMLDIVSDNGKADFEVSPFSWLQGNMSMIMIGLIVGLVIGFWLGIYIANRDKKAQDKQNNKEQNNEGK